MEAQIVCESPAEHFVVARRQQEPRPSELRCSSDQRNQVWFLLPTLWAKKPTSVA
jgi:hypothetical protein